MKNISAGDEEEKKRKIRKRKKKKRINTRENKNCKMAEDFRRHDSRKTVKGIIRKGI